MKTSNHGKQAEQATQTSGFGAGVAKRNWPIRRGISFGEERRAMWPVPVLDKPATHLKPLTRPERIFHPGTASVVAPGLGKRVMKTIHPQIAHSLGVDSQRKGMNVYEWYQ